MTRAFYPVSRKHHAYSMAIDFGMRFKKRNGFWTPEGLLGITGAGGYRIEVAEESLGLLEPVIGDLVEYEMRDCCYVGNPPRRTDVLTKTEGKPAYWPPYHPRKEWITGIIQRNGKPFHWPEFEL